MLEKRLTQVLVLFGVLNLLVVLHLVRLQVWERDVWVAKGEDNRSRRIFGLPLRGAIRLASGKVVARSERRYDLRVDPGKVRDRWAPGALAAVLAKLDAKQGFWFAHGREVAERMEARAELASRLAALESDPAEVGGAGRSGPAAAESRKALAAQIDELDRAQRMLLEAEAERRACRLEAILRDARAEWDRLLAMPLYLLLIGHEAEAGTDREARAEWEECPLDGRIAAQLDAVLGPRTIARMRAFVRDPNDLRRPLSDVLDDLRDAALRKRFERLAAEASAFAALRSALGEDLGDRLWGQILRAEDGARRQLQARPPAGGHDGDPAWWRQPYSRLRREDRVQYRKILRDHLGRARYPARSMSYEGVTELHRARFEDRLREFTVEEYSGRELEYPIAPHVVGGTGEVPAHWLHAADLPDPLDPEAVVRSMRQLRAVARWRIEGLQRRMLTRSGMRNPDEARAFLALEEALLSKPHVGDRDVGIRGIELWHDERLRGRRGIRRFVHVPGARRSVEINDTVAVDGQDVTLTLDEDLQRKAEELLAADRASRKGTDEYAEKGGGALVAIDPRRGAVLVLATDPSYDPRELRDPEVYARLAERERTPSRPLVSRALRPALPGSVFKVFTALVGLQHGIIRDEHTSFSCWGRRPGGPTPGCAYRPHDQGAERVDFIEAICHSCNVYFAKVARALFQGGKRGAFVDAFHAFHLDEPPFWGNGNAYHRGTIALPDAEARMRNMSIGQDPVYVSPFHVAMLYAAVAHGGLWRPPFIVEESPFRQIPEQRLFPARHAALVVKGMREAVRRGTGRNEGLARLARQGIEVAGKTGTATFGSRLQPDRRPKHAWFACFAPADRPEIVVVVFLEHRGLSGGAAAVPIAARFLDHYFGRERTARREGAARR